MNHIFSIVWSKARRAWMVASELASHGGSSGSQSAPRSHAAVHAYGCTFRISSLRLAVMAALIASHAPAMAADQYWDINGSTAGLGGTGNWNLSNPFWGLNSNGTTGPYSSWSNLALDDALFGGTAGTITLGAPITVHDLNFLVSGYTINGSTLTLAGALPEINYSGASTATINSVLAGGNGLIVNGGSTNGWVNLVGTNTLTGGITINPNARLIVSGSNSLNGAANVVTINNGGVLQLQNSNAFGGNTSAANLVINSGGNLWFVNQNLTHDITAHGGTIVISDVAGSGNSTWTGNLSLTADTTVLVNNTGDGDNLLFAGNLTDTGANRLALNLNEGGGINSSLWLTGTNSFTGGITVNSGQLLLSGIDSAAAGAGNVVTMNGGILRVENVNAFGGDTAASRLVLNSGGRFRVGPNLNVTHDVTLNGGTSFIDGLSNATWNGTACSPPRTTLGLGVSGHRLNVTGNLSDTGANVLSLSVGSGEQHFTGNLSFSGDMTIVGGTTYLDGGTNTYPATRSSAARWYSTRPPRSRPTPASCSRTVALPTARVRFRASPLGSGPATARSAGTVASAPSMHSRISRM